MGYGLIDNNTLINIANAIRNKANTSVNYYPREMAQAINQLQAGGFSTPVVLSMTQFGFTNYLGIEMNSYNNYAKYNSSSASRFDFVNVLPENANIIAKADWEPFSQGDVYLYTHYDNYNRIYGLYSPNVNPETISILDMSYICYSAYPYKENAFCTPLTYKMDFAFNGCSYLTNAVCGNNVRYMRRTYQYCSNVTEGVCGDNVIDMSGAYGYCSNVINGHVGPNVVYAFEAFCEGNNLLNLDLGNSVREIKNIANWCNKLTNVVGGDNVVNAEYAFYGDRYLNTVDPFPNIVNGAYTFFNCLSISRESTYNFMVNAKHLENAYQMFSNCTGGVNKAYIHKNLIMAGGMFTNCFTLTQVEQDVENIANYKLNGVDSMFANCYALNEPIIIPDLVTSMYGTYQNCYSLKNYQIGNNVTSISRAFANCYPLNSDVEIPEKVNLIGYAFYGCNAILNIAVLSNELSPNQPYSQINAFDRTIYTYRRNIVLTHRNAYNAFLYCNCAGNWNKTEEEYAEPVEVFVNGKSYNTVRCS